MESQNRIDKLKQYWQEQVLLDLLEGIKIIRRSLKSEGKSYVSTCELEGRYIRLRKKANSGIIDNIDQTREENLLHNNISGLIEMIQPSDILPEAYKTSEQFIGQVKKVVKSLNYFVKSRHPSLHFMEKIFRQSKNANILPMIGNIANSDCFVFEYCSYKANVLRVVQEEVTSLRDSVEQMDIGSVIFFKRFLIIYKLISKELKAKEFKIIIDSEHEFSGLIDAKSEELTDKLEECKRFLERMLYHNYPISSGDKNDNVEVENILYSIELLSRQLMDHLQQIADEARKEFKPAGLQ